LVWLAISLINLTTSPMLAASLKQALNRRIGAIGFQHGLLRNRGRLCDLTADLGDRARQLLRRRGHGWTFVEASSVAAATAVAWLLVSSAVAVIDDAVACSSVEADATDRSTVDMSASNVRVSSLTRAARATRALMPRPPSRKLLGLDHVLLEDQDRSRHQPISSLLSVAGIATE